eukprot:4089903-Prymnesium_polylepis.1
MSREPADGVSPLQRGGFLHDEPRARARQPVAVHLTGAHLKREGACHIREGACHIRKRLGRRTAQRAGPHGSV